MSRTLAILAAAAILAMGFSMREWLIGRMLYYPTPGVDLRPEQIGVDAEQVFLHTRDGVRIHAFYLPAPGADRALLFLHGNAGNASHRLPNAAALQRLGIHVLLLDYRGYGLSEGRPSEEGLYADGHAGLEHLTGARQVAAERVVLFGRSLGGAVAIELARGRPLAGVVLESTFSSLADMASGMFGSPAALVTRDAYDSISKVPELRAPLLSFHGDRDDIVPLALGRRLFEAAPEPKEFVTLRGAGHNDTVAVGGADYFARIRRFLDQVAP